MGAFPASLPSFSLMVPGEDLLWSWVFWRPVFLRGSARIELPRPVDASFWYRELMLAYLALRRRQDDFREYLRTIVSVLVGQLGQRDDRQKAILDQINYHHWQYTNIMTPGSPRPQTAKADDLEESMKKLMKVFESGTGVQVAAVPGAGRRA